MQFGRSNFDGQSVDPQYVDKVNALLSPYGPDGCSSYSVPGTSILYLAFHTTRESRREKQPLLCASGAVITWDGRLDNRSELIGELAGVLNGSSTDAEIVAAAYEEWGERCFGKLIGDWALSVWNARDRSLTLAKDPIGTRHLYFAVEELGVTWSTILDPLVLLAGRGFDLCEEYIAGWLGFFPATHLTPYVGIDSVPPSSFVRLRPGKREIRKYWDFDPGKRIRYRTGGQYEEHFRAVFQEAVRRRLRSDSPILAELSGGMDSSSIVCMADEIIGRGVTESPHLDTISYYDNSEPNWNDRPYFARVEEKRGRVGAHIELAGSDAFIAEFGDGSFPATPYSGEPRTQASAQFEECSAARGSRVVLSGIGGDEVTGGVPTPLPELMDLMSGMRIKTLVRQLRLWALSKRQPWLSLLFEALRGFLPAHLVGIPLHLRPPDWVHPDFAKRHRLTLSGYRTRCAFFGSLPSFRENMSTLESLRRQIENAPVLRLPLHETRYPYLDRDFVEFLYAIPREQVVRPGQRRSLMRRALRGIVPDEILDRRRKAFVVRAPATALAAKSDRLLQMSQYMIAASLEVVDADRFRVVLEKARQGQQIRTVAVLRTLRIESWLKALSSLSDPDREFPRLLVLNRTSQMSRDPGRKESRGRLQHTSESELVA